MVPDILGNFQTATTAAPKPNRAATTDAGSFPPPNQASHGPAPSVTIICGITIARFRMPMASPCPPPDSAISSIIIEFGTERMTANGKPSTANNATAANRLHLWPPPAALRVMSPVHASATNRMKFATAHTFLEPSIWHKKSMNRELINDTAELRRRPKAPFSTPRW